MERLPSSVGLGHTSVGRVDRYTDLAGCPGSAGCRSRPSDMNSCRQAFMFGRAKTGILEPQGSVPQTLTLLRGARFVAWRQRCPFFRGMPTRLKAFLEPPGVSRLRPCARTHLKKALCQIRPVGGTYDFLPAVEPDSFGRTFLPAVLTLLFCIYVLFSQYTCSTYFLYFRVFFLAPNEPQHSHCTQ